MNDPALVPVPQPKQLRDVLTGLLGRTVDLEVAGLYAGDRTSTWASYVDDLGRLRAVAVTDLGFAAGVAAALGLVPPAGAQIAREEQRLTPALRENLHEVLNVCCGVLNVDGHPHVRLREVHHADQPAPSWAENGRNPGRRLDLAVAVAGYGPGRLSVVGLF